ncbi:ARP2/3 actin-organizing complex subunit Sop2 [Nadsonia fulvescens var. elongata DSM 6958]|uniref:Actin-related protein 2/3 complex subunit n=1 Tax=Nadsonia fulvescens var. elongata DSM 6958 TaxID=857566 RepID=A0A1E3PF98_9ASCO|nr:ARP2/3 actin-organizing complex subunit Sop2 [Nadsonia fulvescens var. elongata DSM 6958]
MSQPTVLNLGHQPIADHSFSADHSLLAVACEDNVQLYNNDGKSFTPGIVLGDHDKSVTSIDISPSGRIVTCSQDRNALVWEPQADSSYKPTLVLLRINRAATFVRWSPDETKFAVGSGARAIAVCYFEEENDWWVSKHIKKPIRSTILSVTWHPNSVLIAAGSTDGHARVFSGYIKGVDQKPQPTIWGERLPFQTLCGDFVNHTGAWIHDVAFSPSGDSIAYCAHDSSITVVYPGGADRPPQAIYSVNTSFLPFKSLVWLSNNEIITAGHDCHPYIFSGNENGWEYTASIDDPADNTKEQSHENSALALFKQMDLKGSDQGLSTDYILKTIHQNTINTIRAFTHSGDKVTSVSTSGVDGKVVIFPL